MNLILTGMRGTGKTTTGKALSKRLNMTFIDIDIWIEKETGKKITYIVKEKGWNWFRKLEYKAVKKISALDNQIIATGGGTLLYNRNLKFLKKNGAIILLVCKTSICKDRIINDTKRPSLIKGKDFIAEIDEIWKKRKKRYGEIADVIIDTGKHTVEESVKEILHFLATKLS